MDIKKLGYVQFFWQKFFFLKSCEFRKSKKIYFIKMDMRFNKLVKLVMKILPTFSIHFSFSSVSRRYFDLNSSNNIICFRDQLNLSLFYTPNDIYIPSVVTEHAILQNLKFLWHSLFDQQMISVSITRRAQQTEVSIFKFTNKRIQIYSSLLKSISRFEQP